jgi:hypothetical protein
MTPKQIEPAQISFVKVAPISQQAVEMLSTRLFGIAPPMVTLGVAVGSLNKFTPLLPVTNALAKTHVSYSVEPHDHETVGETPLATLSRVFGNEWTRELQQAWTAAYATISGCMVAEAYGRPAAAE